MVAEATYATAANTSSNDCHSSLFEARSFDFCPHICATSSEDIPSKPMKSGVENLKKTPHHSATLINHRVPPLEDEKRLKQSRRRKGCTGNCKNERASEPHNKTIVPWMREWIDKRNESSKKADFEIVESVRGRNINIWEAVLNFAPLKRVLTRKFIRSEVWSSR